jgi:membrane protein YqaA with SNARE-associated domain
MPEMSFPDVTAHPLAFQFVFAAVGAVVPIFNAELALMVQASNVQGWWWLLMLPAAAAGGQMCGKFVLYGIARVSDEFVERNPKRHAAVERVRERLPHGRWAQGLLIGGSALLGFPPFYGMALACGVLRINPGVFLIAGLTGRYLRFLLCTLAPATTRLVFGL